MLVLQNQDNIRPLGQVPVDPLQLSLKDLNQSTASSSSASDVARIWDPSERSLRASILKGTDLLTYLHSGTKFEHMLQIFQRDVKKDEELVRKGGDEEERRAIQNGGSHERMVSPDRRRNLVSGEPERGVFGTCRWCLQHFPSVAALVQHERHLCQINREAMEFRTKGSSSPAIFFPRSVPQPENSSEVTNGLSGNKSPLQKHNWHAVPQHLLLAMPSPPQLHHNHALSSRVHSSNQEKSSPSQMTHHSPELSSPRGRKRVLSSGFTSPACLDLTSCSPELSSPQKETSSPWSAQNEPLDLSLPKQISDQASREKTVNGSSGRGERRELTTQLLGRPSPTSHLPLHSHPVFSVAGAPVFPGSLYNGFPMFSQSGVGLSGHDGITPIPFNQTANSPGFLSPLAYMMEADAEATLKKIYQERHGLMVSTAFVRCVMCTCV